MKRRPRGKGDRPQDGHCVCRSEEWKRKDTVTNHRPLQGAGGCSCNAPLSPQGCGELFRNLTLCGVCLILQARWEVIYRKIPLLKNLFLANQTSRSYLGGRGSGSALDLCVSVCRPLSSLGSLRASARECQAARVAWPPRHAVSRSPPFSSLARVGVGVVS